MSIPTKRSWWAQIFVTTLTYDLLLAAAQLGNAFAAATIAGWTRPALGVWSIGTAVGLAQAGKGVVTHHTQKRVESVTDIEGCLYTLRAVLTAGEEAGLRITLYVPVKGDQLEQVVDYVGFNRVGAGKGRRFSIKSGAIGDAFRRNLLSVGEREGDGEKHIKFLVEKFGFTDKEARALDPKTYSWAAMPITDLNDNVQAVIYADASTQTFFTTQRLDIMKWGAVGIAYFVGQRYA